MPPKRHREMTEALYRQALYRQAQERSHTDVLGSYTGVPWDDDDEAPVQDADDL